MMRGRHHKRALIHLCIGLETTVYIKVSKIYTLVVHPLRAGWEVRGTCLNDSFLRNCSAHRRKGWAVPGSFLRFAYSTRAPSLSSWGVWQLQWFSSHLSPPSSVPVLLFGHRWQRRSGESPSMWPCAVCRMKTGKTAARCQFWARQKYRQKRWREQWRSYPCPTSSSGCPQSAPAASSGTLSTRLQLVTSVWVWNENIWEVLKGDKLRGASEASWPWLPVVTWIVVIRQLFLPFALYLLNKHGLLRHHCAATWWHLS